MSGYTIREPINSNFYWFNCPECDEKMIFFDTHGKYKWYLRCEKCNSMHFLTMIKILNPKDFNEK
uniref:Uncharacterized protein n=1 Tax=viral metagenome TaxID=1070528 RepID=A0A6M3JSN5_9ZZZZ